MATRISVALAMFVLAFSHIVNCSAQVPAGFSAQGSAFNAKSDWIIEGNKIVAHPGAVETKFPLEPLASLTADEKARGYVCYVRHYLDPINSSSRPSRPEVKSDAVIFATPGEYEPVSVSIFALAPLRGLTASISDLVDQHGSKIASENIDIRVVRRLVCTAEGDANHYFYQPLALEKKSSADVDGNDTLQYWLTIYIPPDAKPTVSAADKDLPSSWQNGAVADSAYKGTFTVNIPGKSAAKFSLAVVVLPFTLAESPRLYGMCYLDNPPVRGTFPQNMPKHMADMRAHGLNSIWTWPEMGVTKKPDGSIVYDFSKPGLFRKDYSYFSLDEIMDAYRKAGFNKFWVCGSMDPLKEIIPSQLGYKMGSPEFEKAYIAFIEQLRAHAKEKNWPPFCLHPIDEPGGNKGVEAAKYYYDLIKKRFPDQLTFADLGPWHGEDADLIPRCDILCLAIPNPENTKKVLDAGKQLWMYNTGSLGHDAKLDRLSWGLVARKIGVKGVFHWVYQWWWDDSVKGGFPTGQRYTHPAPDGPIPTLAWEGVREGIDDDRYAQTMVVLAERTGRSNPTAAASLDKLKDILKPMPGGSTAIPGGDAPALGSYRGEYLARTPSAAFDRNRWEMARCIIQLRALAKEDSQ